MEGAPTTTIVIVEDEAAIAGALAARLHAEGFAFSQRELVARVPALLPRARRTADPPVEPMIVAGSVTVDPERREVHRDDRLVHLTPTELDLLLRLALRPGVVLRREQLLEEVWGYEDGTAGARTVDSRVAARRRKLGADGLRTVQGIGYAFGTPTP